MQRILVAVDFSDCSRHALEAAADLAKGAGADLVLFHAFTMPAKGLGVAKYTDPVSRLYAEGEMEDARTLSEEWAEPLRAQGMTVDVCTVEGRPLPGLQQAIDQEAPSMVVVGHHGRGGFHFGSLAKSLLDKAPCPVLVVPERPK